MNETRRKPTTRIQCPVLFLSGTGSFRAEYTKVLDYPVMAHWGEVKVVDSKLHMSFHLKHDLNEPALLVRFHRLNTLRKYVTLRQRSRCQMKAHI